MGPGYLSQYGDYSADRMAGVANHFSVLYLVQADPSGRAV
jgi:hypothetical protein